MLSDPSPGNSVSCADPPAGYRLRGVEWAYNGTFSLRDIHLDLRAGEAVALVGPSGAGKTTLLRLMNGTLRPQRGELRFDDRDLRELPSRELRATRARICRSTGI